MTFGLHVEPKKRLLRGVSGDIPRKSIIMRQNHVKEKIPQTGLEPAIFGLGSQRLIH